MPALIELLKHILPMIVSSIATKYFDKKHQEEITKQRAEIDRLRQELAKMSKQKVSKRTREAYIRRMGATAKSVHKLRSLSEKAL